MRASRAPAAAVTLVAVWLATLAPVTALAATPTCDGKKATIVGTAGDDVLEGTSGPDVIVGLLGDDVIRGRGGADRICAGYGADRVDAGPGDDRVWGGYDRLDSDAGGDHLVGDVLDGGDGDDLLVAGTDDRAVNRRPDTFSYAGAGSGVVVDLGAGTAAGQGEDTLRFAGPVGVTGTPYDDVLAGSAGRDTLRGLGGDDTLSGGEGPDLLYGDERGGAGGSDRLRGGPGDDLLASFAGRDDLGGGPGHDFLEVWGEQPVLVQGNTGDDYVAQALVREPGAGSDGGGGRDVLALHAVHLTGLDPRPEVVVDLRDQTTTVPVDPPAIGTVGRFEEIRLVGDVAWRFHGSPRGDRVWAVTGGPLRAWGRGGDDWLRGSDRADFLHGGAGRDTAVPGRGADTCRAVERGC